MNLDAKDIQILNDRLATRYQEKGPQVGDVVYFPDGSRRRFSHDWGDVIQTSFGGSFYLGNGYTSYSGGLERAKPVQNMINTGKTEEANFWFFHHDYPVKDGGVDVKALVPVWEYKE
jgi:hypothetical protein